MASAVVQRAFETTGNALRIFDETEELFLAVRQKAAGLLSASGFQKGRVLRDWAQTEPTKAPTLIENLALSYINAQAECGKSRKEAGSTVLLGGELNGKSHRM